MIFSEQWFYWSPSKQLIGKYLIKSVQDTQVGLVVSFISDNVGANNTQNSKSYNPIIIFEHPILSYRVLDEHVVILDACQIEKIKGKDFFVGSNFFKVVDSAYAKNVQEEFLVDNTNFSHYVMWDSNTRIDIVTQKDFLVEWL